jgi:signal transduction histidine kinase
VVLAAALLACGLVLYFGLQDLMLRPVSTSLRSYADFAIQDWLRSPVGRCGEPGGRPPPPLRRPGPAPFYLACFDTDGHLIGTFPGSGGQTTTIPEPFLTPSLVSDALRSGSADDVIEGGADAGRILRLAVVALDRTSGKPVGVVQVGQSVEAQLDALEVLRNLLVLIAAMALIASIALGLILADRALEPARLAFARQQAFIADASHQLRTPLTLLRADAEVLLRSRNQLAPEDAELLDDIVAETAHMDRLASDLLTLARLDAREPHLEQEVFDLSALASEIASRASRLADQKGLTLGQDYRAHPRLLGDRQAVEQAALILVENAIKYTPPGGSVTVRTTAEDGHANLIVEDTGIGIPAEHLEHLGERFYRADPSRSRATGGAGLGLAIAHKIAAAHGGTLQFASRPGEGTRATLSLATVPTNRSS